MTSSTSTPGSPLLEYYRGTGTDHAGRHLDDVLAWDNEALEHVHDYIQWLFPNRDPSRANAAAPLLTADDITAFLADPGLRRTLLCAFERMLRFYGFRRVAPPEGGVTRASPSDIVRHGIAIVPAEDWEERARIWLSAYNHNHLRLTRIMKCLAALGREEDALALQRVLLALTEGPYQRSIARNTARYWREALNDGPQK